MIKKLNVKNIEMFVQQLDSWEKPKVELEQYHTPPRTAAEILYLIEKNYEDISGMRVADFGCGPGILGIGCAYIGADLVTGYDIDDDALSIAYQNLDDTGLNEEMDLVKTDVSKLKLSKTKYYDTIIMNPPFGTRKAGIDVAFLKTAIENCSGSVYSIHKSNTIDFIKKQCITWNAELEIVDKIKFPLPKMFKHQKKSQDFAEVDLIRVYCKDDQ